MKLLVAEKPSLARTLSEALGFPLVNRDGSLPEGVEAAIVPLVGHVVELEAPEAYGPEYANWSFETLPLLPESFLLRPIKASEDVYRAAVKAMKASGVTEVVNACDPGREGELIFSLVVKLAGVRKPLLRLWPVDLTQAEIVAAWKNLKPASWKQGLCEAALCRSEADWMLGMNATRAQTIAARAMGGDGVFSIGRVQTPTLNLVVTRDLAIKNFVPKTYWTLEATFQAQEGAYVGKLIPKDGSSKDALRFEQEAPARDLVARLTGKPGLVRGMVQKDEKEGPQQLYDLSALQQACNKRLGLTAEETLKAAQALYEDKKVLSYPRTNSRYLTDGVAAGLPEVLETLRCWPQFESIVGEIERAGNLRKALGKQFVNGAKVEDHWALVPTKLDPEDAKDRAKLAEIKAGTFLSGVLAQVFDLVARRFLAAYFPDRVVGKTEILTEVDGEPFRTTGSVVKVEGWSAIDPKTGGKKKGKAQGAEEPEEEGDGDAERLPLVRKGEAVATKDLQAKTGKTTPPKPLSEADLLAAMETAGKFVDDEAMREAMKKNGLGTPATRANIIETLLKREYIERKKTTLLATPKGISLIQCIQVESLKSPELTGEWEAKMALMETGEYTRAEFETEIRAYVSNSVASIRANIKPGMAAAMGGFEPKNIGKCPKCQTGDLWVRSYKGQAYVQCSSEVPKEKIYCVSYSSKPDGTPLKKCKFCGSGVKSIPYVNKATKKKGIFEVCGVCDKPQKERFDPVEVGPCPKCGGGKLWHRAWEGRHYIACDRQEPACYFGYDLKADGTPAKVCKFAGCGGFVKTTKKGPICSTCDEWQIPKSFGKKGAAPKKAGRAAQ